MNNIEAYNIKLLNLIPAGHTSNILMHVINSCKEHPIEKKDIYIVLGNTIKAKRVVDDLDMMKDDYSLYCLLYFDVNIFIIEKLYKLYKDLKNIPSNFSTIKKRIRMHKDTFNKIQLAKKEIEKAKSNGFDKVSLELSTKNIEDLIFEEIELNEPINNIELKECIVTKYNISTNIYFDNLSKLINSGIVISRIDGFVVKKITIKKFLEESNNEKDLIVYKKCKGQTLESIGKEYSLSRERIHQIIDKTIEKYPKFEQEEKYKDILCEYKLDFNELKILGLNDYILFNYVRYKYKCKPQKTAVELVDENKLFNTKKGRNLLRENNLVYIYGEFIRLSFIDLFNKFILIKKIKSFNLNDLITDFNGFLLANGISDKVLFFDEHNLDERERIIARRKNYIEISNKSFLVYYEDLISFEFLELARNFLEDFSGYGSVSLFYDQNVELCKKNDIMDENQLYALLKTIFADELKNIVSFVRNPIICSQGVDKKIYIENLLLDMDLPCSVDSYLEHIVNVTGIKKQTLVGNFNDIINKYKNSNGLLSLNDDLTTDEEVELINLIDSKCIGSNYLRDRIEIHFNHDSDKVNLFFNSNVLKKIGYNKTKTTVYDDKYPNRNKAVYEELLKSDYILSENALSIISNKELFYYKIYDLIDECFVIKINDNNYLNLVRREQTELVKKLKKDIETIAADDEIYILENFIESESIKKLFEANKEYHDLLYTFNELVMMRFLITTSRVFNFLNTQDTLIFSKAELSYKIIIDRILCKFRSLYISKLEEKMAEEYKIYKKFSNAELSEMGYYCTPSSEKVYIDRKQYEKEMGEFLNGNFKSKY